MRVRHYPNYTADFTSNRFANTLRAGMITLHGDFMQSYELNERIEVKVVQQQKLYHEYALAAEAYVKKPTIYNWEEKEKAFENYNALIKSKKVKETA